MEREREEQILYAEMLIWTFVSTFKLDYYYFLQALVKYLGCRFRQFLKWIHLCNTTRFCARSFNKVPGAGLPSWHMQFIIWLSSVFELPATVRFCIHSNNLHCLTLIELNCVYGTTTVSQVYLLITWNYWLWLNKLSSNMLALTSYCYYKFINSRIYIFGHYRNSVCNTETHSNVSLRFVWETFTGTLCY